MATTVERAPLAAGLEAWPTQLHRSLDALADTRISLLCAQTELRDAPSRL